MLYTASWKKGKDYIHGQAYSISLKAPRNLDFPIEHLDFFKPTQGLLDFWYQSDKSEQAWQEYESRYWKLILAPERKNPIMSWLNSLPPQKDCTLCCFEVSNRYCHRRLVELIIRKYRPELWVGDSIRATLEIGDRVEHKLLPQKGIGTVLDRMATLAYVIWDDLPLGAVRSVVHPVKSGNYYNQIGNPLPYPGNLLRRIEESNNQSIKG
jgi:hypothetical protein